MLQVLALVIAALFTGAAAYVNFVEHPARMTLPDAGALAQWRPAYKRGTLMQAPLAILGLLAGLAAWWWGGRDWRWLGGGLVIGANWPYTLLAIMPVNHRLVAAADGVGAGQARALLGRWNRLHAGRTTLGAIALALFAWALACP